MTEAEWLSGRDPEPMSFHVVKGSARKLRLFAVACARRLPPALVNDDCRRPQALLQARREYLRAVIDYNTVQFTLQRALGWPVGQPDSMQIPEHAAQDRQN